jgi:hypothetical protein
LIRLHACLVERRLAKQVENRNAAPTSSGRMRSSSDAPRRAAPSVPLRDIATLTVPAAKSIVARLDRLLLVGTSGNRGLKTSCSDVLSTSKA